MPSEESLLQDLREIEAILRTAGEHRKANSIDLYIKTSTHCKIKKSRIKEKIDEIKEDKDSKYYDMFLSPIDTEHAIEILEELLKEEG